MLFDIIQPSPGKVHSQFSQVTIFKHISNLVSKKYYFFSGSNYSRNQSLRPIKFRLLNVRQITTVKIFPDIFFSFIYFEIQCFYEKRKMSEIELKLNNIVTPSAA